MLRVTMGNTAVSPHKSSLNESLSNLAKFRDDYVAALLDILISSCLDLCHVPFTHHPSRPSVWPPMQQS